MKNATELRSELSKVFEDLKAGKLDVKQASELANLAGKMISSASTQIKYYELKGDKPDIRFLDSN